MSIAQHERMASRYSSGAMCSAGIRVPARDRTVLTHNLMILASP